MKIGLALHELHRSENHLAQKLLHVSERHKADYEIYHLARDLAGWSQRHVREVAEIAGSYGHDLDPQPKDELGLAKRLRERSSELKEESTQILIS